MSLRVVPPGHADYHKGATMDFWGRSFIDDWSMQAAQEMKNTLDREMLDLYVGMDKHVHHDDMVLSAAMASAAMSAVDINSRAARKTVTLTRRY